MPLRSSTPDNIDDDGNINNKPTATDPNDGTVDRTPSVTINDPVPVTLSPNDVHSNESNHSPSSRFYRPLENATESPSDSVMVHYYKTYVSSPNTSLENNNDLLSSNPKNRIERINERNYRRVSKMGFSLSQETLLPELRNLDHCNDPKSLLERMKQCYRHFEIARRKKRIIGTTGSDGNGK